MRLKVKRVLQTLTFIIMLVIVYIIIKSDHDMPRSSQRSESQLNNQNIKNNQEESLIKEKKALLPVSSREKVKEERVKDFVEKYKIAWDSDLQGNPWEIATSWMSKQHVIPEDTPELGGVLKAMATRKITGADVGYKGTQLKLQLLLEGGQKVAFKPKKYPRDHVITGLPYSGQDRHNGEIVAFHLSRLLDYRVTPIAVGRRISLDRDVRPVGTKTLLDTFYTENGETCFYGKCLYCKGPETGLCEENGTLEGAVILWLPENVALTKHYHPWVRNYKTAQHKQWEDDENFCRKVMLKTPEFFTGRRIVDLIDTAILDFLVGNADRHQYETTGDKQAAFVVMLDNGKSVGNPHEDEVSILAPLYHCCRVRESTWERVQLLDDGVLSVVLQTITSGDPISPLLTDPHFQALDRRLLTVIDTVKQCFDKFGAENVIIKDR